MNNEQLRKIFQDVIEKGKWKDIISRFIDVLKINILLVDYEGQVIVSSTKDLYGWKFFAEHCLGLKSVEADKGNFNLLQKFVKSGDYADYRCASGLQSFLVPIQVESGETIASLLVGPIILNKKENSQFYQEISRKLSFGDNGLEEVLGNVRVISHITIKSILDLLNEVARDVTQLHFERKRLSQMRINQKVLPKQVSEVAQEIYATIHLDELLVTLLDIALKMTNAECGSIMILENDCLSVKASRGIDLDKIEKNKSQLRLGLGIAGVAAQENTPFIIHGQEGSSRIKSLLMRSDVKHSIVMPLSTKNRVFGVLNLHTKSEENIIESRLDNLQYLTKLISAAFQSI